MNLHMIQLQPDPAALVRFLQFQGLNRSADEDLGYGTHAWLAATFGTYAPKPFRLFMDPKNRKPPKLLAYTTQEKDDLLEHARTFAEPAARVVCDLARDLSVAEMPQTWQPGRRFGFEILACPVARKSRSGVEKDAFLQRADHAEQTVRLKREDVYEEWLTRQLENACSLESMQLAGFRLVRQFRKGQRTTDGRQATSHVRPHALLRGVVAVRDSQSFAHLLARGIGRHRAFGYGMLLLRPS